MQRAVQTALFTLLFLVIFGVCAERYTDFLTTVNKQKIPSTHALLNRMTSVRKMLCRT